MRFVLITCYKIKNNMNNNNNETKQENNVKERKEQVTIELNCGACITEVPYM